MKAAASTVSSLGPLVDHVVIIVKENHTYDNYFGTFPNSEGDNKLGKAQNPPPSDPNHRHEAWMTRDTELGITRHPGFMAMVWIAGRRILRLAQFVIALGVRKGAEIIVVSVVFLDDDDHMVD